MSGKENLFGLTASEIVSSLSGLGLPGYRGRQIYRWIYARGVNDFREMTDLPLALREKLQGRFVIRLPAVRARRRSVDGTVKNLFSLEDGLSVEAVSIPDSTAGVGRASVPSRHTFCVSTQVGCPLGCTFCCSGTVPFARNLTSGEIVGQLVQMKKDLESSPPRLNVVFMGMGEPLLNPEAVLRSVGILADPDALGVSPRRITVSTVGLARELERFAQAAPAVGLAVSLHATTNKLRDRLMPINKKYPLEVLMESLRRLPLPPRRRITFEYVLLGGENDSVEDAERMVRLFRGVKAKVNLITFNPWPGAPHRPSSREETERFCQVLVGRGYTVSVRSSRGEDIMAACGQLVGART